MMRKQKELLECLWIKFYNQPAPVKGWYYLKKKVLHM